MEKHYKKLSLPFLVKGIVTGVLFMLSSSARAQLSGSYTINSGAASSATNYTSWGALASALNTSGVSGAVSVTVITNETATSEIVFNAISGVSATNTININGNAKVLGSSSLYEAITLNGTDYLTLRDLTIQKTGTGTVQTGIRLTGAADYNTLSGLTIEFTAQTTGSTAGGAYIAFASSATSLTTTSTTQNGSFNTIRGCLFRTTNAASPGPTYGIIDQQSTSAYTSTANNNTFQQNTIRNFFFYAIYNRYTNGEQFINNDISRLAANSSSPVNTTVYGVFTYYTYGTNRSTVYRGNNFHDMPYAGALASSTTNYINTYYTFFGWYLYGTSSLPVVFDGNTTRLVDAYTQFFHAYLYYSYSTNFVNNVVDKNESYLNTTNYLHWFYYSYDNDIAGNRITNNSFSSIGTGGTTYMFYNFFNYNSVRTLNRFEDNRLDSNICAGSIYTAYLYYCGSLRVLRNSITNNRGGATTGFFYGFLFYYGDNLWVNSNLLANNYGYTANYNFYSYGFSSGFTCDIRQNTLHTRPSSYIYHFAYGYLFQETNSQIRFVGNILDADANYYIYPVYLLANSATNVREINFNSYLMTGSGTQVWRSGTSNYSNYSGWKGDILVGAQDNYTNPQWVNFSKMDMRSNSFETQNNKPTNSAYNLDQQRKSRNTNRSDRGALENYMDITAFQSRTQVPSSVCAGFSTTGRISIRNTFADTIYNYFVAFSVDGKVTRERVTRRLLPNDTFTYQFTTPIKLDIAGNSVVKVFLDLSDDNPANDTFTFKTTVKPAPGGGFYAFSSKKTTPNNALYQKSRPFDVTVLNVPVIYDVVAPRIYSNSTYGTSKPNNWFASVQAFTKAGKAITGATFTAPSGSTNLEVQFQTSDATLEDSTITVVLKITDNNNGCDTNIRRNILIYPSINVDFAYPSKICNGDDVLFTNNSKVNSGSMEFFWNYGTGVAADTSNAPEPVFRFPSAGKFSVLLTAKTMPYGFVFTKKYDVDVNAIPTVAFDKANACLGQDLVFTNKTTPNTAKFTWNFGVAGATASTTDAKYKYSKAGTYNVTLSADLNGCVAKTTQKVYQFEKPVTKFSLTSGTCDNDKFVFTNKSTIGNGIVGSSWNFDDNGSVSTDDNATYNFSKPGKKNVKLVSMSEFGCKDSMTVVVDVRESPKAGFTNTPACSLTPTVFTNTTADVNGAVANYDWNFGDGTTSKAKSPSRSWTNLGPKTVVLKITLDNGCSSSISKELNVATQPKVNFSAADVCAGDQVIFVNNTTWPQGDINYTWDFGDNTSSINSDPSKLYNIVQTTSYNVTLYASIVGGCSDSLTQRVTVNESPRTCDFQSTPDYGYSYYGVKVEPVNGSGVSGGQNNVDYTWIFAGGGTLKSKDVNAAVNYDLQSDGEYTVTMKALVRQTGCECTKTKKVVMNRAAVKDLQEVGVAVYPNPTAGDIKVATSESFGANITVTVMTIEGKMVSTTTTANDGVMTLNTGDMSNGVYLVQVMSGNKQVTRKITVQK
jgi:PKD repeat protein